ncbi:MAG: purine-nucleoside phosphorylase [Ignavibacteriales bacterium]|nr:purine-nucleoside phosphorylase [Ignavibacteriales bacterium]
MSNEQLRESISFIQKKTSLRPTIAIVLGSGLGDFGESLSNKTVIDTSTIPNYPVSTVEGHKGKLIFGKLKNIPLLAFQGRIHFYESGNLGKVLYPIHVAHSLGIKTLIVTNAAGGINKNFTPGDLMLITDHINLTFLNPLSSIENNYELRITNYESTSSNLKSQISNDTFYNEQLCEFAERVALNAKIKLQKGVYCGLQGPTYETAAEIQMLKNFGADAVGMSTVNEVTLAVNYGMNVVGFSCITNLGTGISLTKLSHAEVTETGNRVKKQFAKLISLLIEEINRTKK